MISGLEAVKSKRVWFVENFSVWGGAQDSEIQFLIVEQVDSTQSILFGTQSIGSNLQEVQFTNLSDHRGNNLPVTIDTPRVIIRSKGDLIPFVVGTESDNSFKIAAPTDVSEPLLCDLMVIEMGK